MILATHGIVSSYVGVDTDALAFITAANITDTTQKNAVNYLTASLKSYNLWNKCKAIYPIVGNNAISHKYNLKDPRDLDAAFRLQFVNGWTHSSTGALPSGTDGYANTFINPSSLLSINSAHFSKYNRNNDLIGTKIDGCYDVINDKFMQQNYSNGNGILGDLSTIASYTPSNSIGLFTTSRSASNLVKVYKNSTQISTNTTIAAGLPNINIYIGARNERYTLPTFHNSYECAFASIGDSLSDVDVINLSNIVQNFNTILGR